MLWRINWFTPCDGLPVPLALQREIQLLLQLKHKISASILQTLMDLRRVISSMRWLSNVLTVREKICQAKLEGQLHWETGIRSKVSRKNYSLAVESHPSGEVYQDAGLNLRNKWFSVVLIDSASLVGSLFSSCISGPLLLVPCIAVAHLALFFFVRDQAVPWQINQPFPLFVNHLI